MRAKWILMVVVLGLTLGWFMPISIEAVTTRLSSEQLAATATNTYVLTTDGDWNVWVDPATLSTAPAGANTQIQFNNNGAFGADADLTFTIGSNTFAVGPTGLADKVEIIPTEIGMFEAVALEKIFSCLNGTNGTVTAWNNDAGASVHLIDGQDNGDVEFNTVQEARDFTVRSDNHINAIFLDGSEDIISVVGVEVYIGDADTQTDLVLTDGSANFFSDVYPPSAIDAGWERPNDIPGAGEFLKVEGVVGNIASLEYAADNNTHVSQFVGYISGAGLPGDAYINMDLAGTTAFAGTGVNDIVGYGLPWNISIVGISANYMLDDFSGVTTIDIYPREDGANINAVCKLTLAETGLNRDSVSVTFAAGTYTVVADQTLGIYIDTTTTGVPLLTDLIVTVYYHYSL